MKGKLLILRTVFISFCFLGCSLFGEITVSSLSEINASVDEVLAQAEKLQNESNETLQSSLSESLQRLSNDSENMRWFRLLARVPRQVAIKVIQEKPGNISAYRELFSVLGSKLSGKDLALAKSLLPRPDGSIDLFNESFDGWKISNDKERTWYWDGNELVCERFAYLGSVVGYSDFDLYFEFKLISGSNNGIGFRQTPDHFTEVQILDNTAPDHQNLKGFQYSGSLYGITAASAREQRPLGEWNAMSIHLRGRNIKVVGNDGVVLVDVNMDDAVKKIKREHYDADYEYAYKAIESQSGELVFLGHSGPPVHFRNIRIKNAEK